MEPKKYKVCPVCQFHNPPSKVECRKCEADLTSVRVVDEAIEQQEAQRKAELEQKKQIQPDNTLVRVCECGEINPPQARKCRACGEDIFDIIPTRAADEEKKSFTYRLTSFDEKISISIDKPVFVIGREAELQEYLASKMYVSRQHCQITIVADKALVLNLSRTNRTFINNEEISNEVSVALNNGDEIALGGKVINGSRQEQAAYFRFEVEQ